MAKFSMDQESTKSTLRFVLIGILKMLHPFMPYVTDEIYHEITPEEITTSSYPEYEKDLVFKKEEEQISDVLNFVSTFRNIKQENNIGKDYQVYFETNVEEIAKKLLKISAQMITTERNQTGYSVIYKNMKAIIYYEKEETEEDRLLKARQKEELKQSIARREKLLQNENYVKKAPAHLVEEEKKKLELEQEKLKNLE